MESPQHAMLVDRAWTAGAGAGEDEPLDAGVGAVAGEDALVLAEDVSGTAAAGDSVLPWAPEATSVVALVPPPPPPHAPNRPVARKPNAERLFMCISPLGWGTA